MSKVDWSLAKSWADRVVVGPLTGKKYWANEERRIQFGGEFDCKDDNHIREGWTTTEFKPKPWSGPEDGLPPINERVEVLWSSITGKYVEGIILAHDEDRAVFRFVTGERKGEYQADKLHFSSGKLWPNFRPIKTPEQLAAEKREAAIREVMDIAQVDCRVTAARLVDSGFKREVA